MGSYQTTGQQWGSNPGQRAGGPWQVHIRYTDEDGTIRPHTAYGSTAKEARDNAAEVRARLRADLPAKDRKITLGEFTAEWIPLVARGIDPRNALLDALDGSGPPRLVLVCEPDQLGVEGAHAQLAFGVRLVELAGRHR